MIPGLYAIGKKVYKSKQLKHRLNDLAEIEDLNILRISSGVPTYEYNHITIKESGKKFHIGFPEDLKTLVLARDPEFFLHDDCSFDGSKSFDDVVKRTDILNLVDLIDKHRRLIAEKFINRDDGCLFNRPKYGVYRISHENRTGQHEEPEVKMDLFDTDYFTHRIFRSIYQELKDQAHPISLLTQENLHESLFKYNAFTTSLGLNAYLITNSNGGESVIFSRRSTQAAYAENRYKYNSTVMEGISQADYSNKEKKVILQSIIERAFHEELGIPSDHFMRYGTWTSYCDFFLEKNYFEIGITAMTKMDAIFEEEIRDLPAQDKELEISKLHAVRKSKEHIEAFIEKEEVYAQGLFTLKMILMRESIFINIRKKNIH